MAIPMNQYNLSFISDEDIFNHVKKRVYVTYIKLKSPVWGLSTNLLGMRMRMISV